MAFSQLVATDYGIPCAIDIQGYIDTNSTPDPSTFIGSSLLTDEEEMSEVFAWDVLEPIGGLANAYEPGSDPMVSSPRKLKTMTEETMYWADTYQLTSKRILRTRRPGSTQFAGEQLAMDLVNIGNRRLTDRKEQQIWATILGSNVIDSNGVKKTIDYSSFMAEDNGSPDTAWNLPATADPIEDLQTWAELFDGVTDGKITAYISGKTAKWLARNAAVRDLVKQSSNVTRIGVGNVASLIIELAGVNIDKIVVYKGGYRDVAGTTLTRFIPEGKLILIADPPSGQKLGAFKTTPATQNGGLNPKPGRFSVTEDKLQTKRSTWEITIGQHGLPVLYFPGCIAVFTVYTP